MSFNKLQLTFYDFPSVSVILALDFNVREERYLHESILFGFPGSSDEVIAISYCMLYAKHYIYLEKLKEENKIVNLT